MATERKLDIFRVLAAVDTKDHTFLPSLTDEEAKAFVPFVVARWMSGTTDARQVYFLNEVVNPYLFSLAEHKELLWNLMTVANSGKKQRYAWNALPSRKKTSTPLAVEAVKQFYGYSTRDAVDACTLLSADDVVEMATSIGWQPEDVKKLTKELKSVEK